jgi:hypothetical protein
VGVRAVQLNVLGFDGQRAAARHCISRVGAGVQEDLFHLDRVNANGPCTGIQYADEPDIVTNHTAQVQLFKALAGGAKLASVHESLECGYQDLHKRVSAAWMWASVYDSARFVLQKYAARATAKEGKASAALLERLAAFAQLSKDR